MCRKWHRHNHFTCIDCINRCHFPYARLILYLVPIFNRYKQKYLTGNLLIWNCQTSVFKSNIFHVSIVFLFINLKYMIPNLYCTTLWCNHNIGPTLHYLKYHFIKGFIFEGIIIIEHDFISDFIVVVYYFTIFVGLIFICLCLLLLTY